MVDFVVLIVDAVALYVCVLFLNSVVIVSLFTFTVVCDCWCFAVGVCLTFGCDLIWCFGVCVASCCGLD